MSFARLTFNTAAFMDTAETLDENVNGIGGKALAEWLATALRERGFDVSPVGAEDHGWDFGVTHAGARYHCSASLEGVGSSREGGITFSKSRTLMDRVAGRNKLATDDALVATTRELLAQHAAVHGLAFEMAG